MNRKLIEQALKGEHETYEASFVKTPSTIASSATETSR